VVFRRKENSRTEEIWRRAERGEFFRGVSVREPLGELGGFAAHDVGCREKAKPQMRLSSGDGVGESAGLSWRLGDEFLRVGPRGVDLSR